MNGKRDRIHIITVVGARPQFIKAAVVSRAIRNYNEKNSGLHIFEEMVHTGQHYDHSMSGVFFDKLGIPRPAVNLGVNSCDHGEMTGRMLMGLEDVFKKESPDLVLVYGDTNSTLAGALAASKLHIPVAHVEAGLRSYNKRMPEEINRVVADHISDLLFCPTRTAVENLSHEGIDSQVRLVGDVMYDSVLFHKGLADGRSEIMESLGLISGQYILATVHRAENTGDPERLRSIFQALDIIGAECFPVVVPLHPNTRQKIAELGPDPPHVRCIDPVSYLEMLVLEQNSRMILTDSGGVQKEAYWFSKPCVTLRDETEWVETLDSGCNVIVGAATDAIVAAVKKSGSGNFTGQAYGDGHAGRKIVELLLEWFLMIHSSNN